MTMNVCMQQEHDVDDDYYGTMTTLGCENKKKNVEKCEKWVTTC